ncbi:MAG: DUF45 domain-containing protein [Methanomassiliicoccales archaeon]|nr:DUF45 domain-containing protein [Methanomassiliicoccales archaeon]
MGSKVACTGLGFTPDLSYIADGDEEWYLDSRHGDEMGNSEPMTSVFQSVGSSHGFRRVDAEFRPFKEFKTTWERCGEQADFKVTDYLRAATEPVLQDFAETIFTRIKRRRREEYTERMKAWLRSDDFLSRNRPLYLGRSRNLSLTPQGLAFDLRDLAESLRADGLIDNCEDAYLTWTDRPNRSRMGYCSLLMRVVAISSALDSPKIPEEVARYVLYHELLHLELGVGTLRGQHDIAFRRAERLYPKWRESEGWLKRIASG